MIYDSIGVNLTDAKRALTVSRLSKRLRELNLNSISQYLDLVKSDPLELETMFNLITTNVTKFFREPHHFDYLLEHFLPVWESGISDQRAAKSVRIWSAACSTGEEPYTIAMVLHRYFTGRSGRSAKILASDINTEALKKSKEGLYKRQEVEGIPYDYLTQYFKLGTGMNKGLFRIKDVLKNMINFRRINLSGKEDYPISGELDIIFCRNVFIYFDRETQKRILSRFYKHLKPGGLLCLGHSESINTANSGGERWHLIKHTIYEKLD